MIEYKVHIINEVYSDLIDIKDYINQNFKASLTAKKYVDDLLHRINELKVCAGSIALCRSKSIIELYGDDVRRINFKSFAIIYIIDGEDVFVIKIIKADLIID